MHTCSSHERYGFTANLCFGHSLIMKYTVHDIDCWEWELWRARCPNSCCQFLEYCAIVKGTFEKFIVFSGMLCNLEF